MGIKELGNADHIITVKLDTRKINYILDSLTIINEIGKALDYTFGGLPAEEGTPAAEMKKSLTNLMLLSDNAKRALMSEIRQDGKGN